MNLAGIDDRLLCTWFANTIANIAHCIYVLPRSRTATGRDSRRRAGRACIVNRLTIFASNSGTRRPGATRRHKRHVASVEIRPESWNDACRRNRRITSIYAINGGAVRRFGRIYIEGTVFLNDPAIVADYGSLIFAVQNPQAKPARAWAEK